MRRTKELKVIAITLVFMVSSLFMFLHYKEYLQMNDQNGGHKLPVVQIRTSLGDINVELYPEKAPETVANFLKYVDEGHYNNTIFHRVIDGFMIQGGGFSSNLAQKKTRAGIKNEAHNGLRNVRGTLAMARAQDVNSATAQFFINVADNAFLDYQGDSPQEYGYCVFGKVVIGMDVVDKIKVVPTETQGPYSDLPAKPVEITGASRLPVGKSA